MAGVISRRCAPHAATAQLGWRAKRWRCVWAKHQTYTLPAPIVTVCVWLLFLC